MASQLAFLSVATENLSGSEAPGESFSHASRATKDARNKRVEECASKLTRTCGMIVILWHLCLPAQVLLRHNLPCPGADEVRLLLAP